MKSLVDRIFDIAGGRERRRIAVLGLENCGKTVFLFSLANHLMHHDPSLLDLDGWKVEYKARSLADDSARVGPHSFPPFPYDEARKKLVSMKWPDGTREESILSLPLDIVSSEGRRKKILLEILDLPGERIADFTMYDRNFQEWSRYMEEHAGRFLVSGAYRQYLEKAALAKGASEVLELYRDFLASEYANHVFSLAPSCVHFGRGNSGGKDDTAEEFRAHLSRVPLGLDGESEFAPLPSCALEPSHPLAQVSSAFSQAYARYRKAKVEPLARWLAASSRAYYLVDIPGILKQGPERKNAEQRFGSAALELFTPPTSDIPLLPLILRARDFIFRTRPDAVRLVATQIDRMAGESSRSNAEDLLRKLFADDLARIGFGEGEVRVFSCAAVRTTRDGKNGTLGFSDEKGVAPGQNGRAFTPSAVPASWPDSQSWLEAKKEKKFSFPSEHNIPFVDASEDVPPDHLKLEKIVADMLGLARRQKKTKRRFLK